MKGLVRVRGGGTRQTARYRMVNQGFGREELDEYSTLVQLGVANRNWTK